MTHVVDAPPPTERPVHSADDLQISRLRALRGPNYWRLAPVIACDIRLGDLEHASSADITDFTTRLLAILPGLEEHTCSCGESGRFVDRLLEGTFLPHVLEHVALELQALAGSDVRFGRVAPSGDPGVWWVIVAYEEEEVGLAAVAAGVDILRACISGHRLDSQSAIAALQDLHEEVRLGPSTAAIVEEARRRGIPVRRLNNRSLIQLGLGRNQRRVQATMTDTTSAIAAEIAQNKDETKRVLRHTGLPVPRGEVATSIEEAVAFAEEIGYPLLLKPLDASHGRGISQRLTSPAQLREAWAAAAAIAPQVLVEQFAQGRDHRVLVVNGAVVAVAERVPAHVVGDGSRTIAQLIDQENQDPRRGVGHRKPLTQLPADEHTAAFLARHGLALDSVPGRGETVFLRATANLSTGGTSIDRTDDIHPDNVTACQLAAHAVGLDVAGIDIMTRDISVPLRENGAVILEVNAAPGIRMHTHPAVGPARNVAAPVIDMLFPPGTPTTIPIIAVTGTNGKTTTVRLIAHLFRHTGKAVGFTTTDGIYLQNRLVMEGDTTGPFSANVVLSNPTVDVAVLETARGGLIRAGLGFEEADVGVVLNVSSDHLGLGGITTLEQLADVKAVVAAVVKREGHAVLNADDPRVYAMRHKTPGDVVLLSSGRDSTVRAAVEDHVADHGIAVCVEDDTFVIRRGRLRIPIAGVREVPLTMGGAARFQIGNVLAAIAAGYVQGVRYDDVRAGLLSFFPSPAMTPGRLNVMRVGDGRVIVDYAHNRAAMEALLDFAWCVPAERRVGVIAVPGDRRDDDVRAVGRLAARLDSVIIKEDEETRGRTRGVVAELLREGLHEGGMSDDRIEIIHDEREAVTRVLDRLDADTLGMVFAANVRSVLSLVEARARASARTSARGE